MARIRVLDKTVAELIAAGEVVERPASIVKELVENSIDAGATAITVEIRGGGVSYIRISDNGCGIDREDIPRAFIRHATSKVRSADDLSGIRTLGFRGEALASVAAMCRVELTTKTIGETEGTTYRIEGGEAVETYPAGCPTGTTIVVRDIFFNTPARMKFLKKDVSEGNSVAQVMDKCALSHPEVAFRFIRDRAVKLNTSGGGDLLSVIYAIYGKEFADSMIPVDYTYEDRLRVSGYISRPVGAKASRAYQTFFINGRYVRTRTASAALEEAFKQKLTGGKYPACVLNLAIDAETVDVNVHPAKIEVRFVEERPIFQTVYFGIKSSLAALDAPLDTPTQPDPVKPKKLDEITMHLPQQEYRQQRMSAREFQTLFGGGEQKEEKHSFNKPVSFHSPSLDISVDDEISAPFQVKATFSDKKDLPQSDSIIIQPEPPASPETVEEKPSGPEYREEPPELRLIGEVFGTYILLEQGEDFLLVDKHAAHERILYEELKKNLAYGNKQQLLQPVMVTLARENYDAVLGSLERLDAMGFGVEDFGGGAVMVRGIPIELGEKDIACIIDEIAEKIRSGNQDLTPESLDRLYYSIACRGAVKGGDKNHPLELMDIVNRLRQNPQITHCPHGRPVMVRQSRHAVEKMFGRLG